MHSLDVIIARNDQAAGREAGHADNDDKDRLASEIQAAQHEQDKDTDNLNFITGYLRGRSEG
jgi:hypothetical protein